MEPELLGLACPQLSGHLGFDQAVDPGRAAAHVRARGLDEFAAFDGPEELPWLFPDALRVHKMAGILVRDPGGKLPCG